MGEFSTRGVGVSLAICASARPVTGSPLPALLEKGRRTMSPTLQNRNATSKSCSVSGCSGMMTFQRRPEMAGGPQGSSGATWVCNSDPSHIEVVGPGEEQGSR